MATKGAVIDDSAAGTTCRQAPELKEGPERTGAEVRLRKARELAPAEAIFSDGGWSRHRLEIQGLPGAEPDDLGWADAIVFGTPTRCGLPSAQVEQFIATAGGRWARGAPGTKVVSSFASDAIAHGGRETTIVALNNVADHRGAIIVAPGSLDPVRFVAGNPSGASHVSEDGETPPGKTALALARFRGRPVAGVAVTLAGVPELVAA